MKRYIKCSEDSIKPSDAVREQNRSIGRKWNATGMEPYDINGITVKTNYGGLYPTVSGNSLDGYHRVDPESDTVVFNRLVEDGYTWIRFVDCSTSVRGYRYTYYKAKR